MSQQKRILSYGLWPSPLGPHSLAAGVRISDVAWDSDGATLVWLEGRSDRGVLVCLPTGEDAPRDLTTDLAVRARVGYGGGDFAVAGGYVYFCEANGRLYRQALASGSATPLTPGFGYCAAPVVSPDQRWVVVVHTYEERDCLAVVDTQGCQWPQQLVSGADFYMQPCWHPHGTQLAWVEWNHPQMPWEGSRLQLATVCLDDGLPRVTHVRTLAGSETVGIFQPTFAPDGRLLAYISNQSGWSNLYLYNLQTNAHRALTADNAELGQPAWQQGMRTYGFCHDSKALYYLRNEQGIRRLWRYDVQRHAADDYHAGLESYTFLEQPALSATQMTLACIASASTLPPRLLTVDLTSPVRTRIRKRTDTETVPTQEFSSPQALSWNTVGGSRVHGLFYLPTSSRFQATGRPPAIIHIHGGPTSQAVANFHPQTQFFTTRGYAVLQVNHRGSTGYGRDYVNALCGQWGVYDVEDAVSGATYLVQQGWVDENKLVIMGGSAGGYTVLQALVHHAGFFKAAVCLYGISNLFTLAATTHKFEAHYLDSLIGPLPAAATLYRERSPLFVADAIVDPVIIFQGEIDQVVPKVQAEALVASLQRRGVPHEYHLYAGEGHGWRKSETIAAFYTAMEAFLRQYVLYA